MKRYNPRRVSISKDLISGYATCAVKFVLNRFTKIDAEFTRAMMKAVYVIVVAVATLDLRRPGYGATCQQPLCVFTL